MGIPAYYKKLSSSIQGLIARGHPSAVIHWLFMDFNCLIYHCLPKMPPYSQADHDAWETALIECIVRDTKRVVGEVAPEKGVLIAIDGVVPMAKMRQQRLRRFKSVWEKVHSMSARLEMAKPSEKAYASRSEMAKCQENDDFSWDKNAITPGTIFMKNLATALQAMCDEKGWILSSSESPGEGEHKVLTQWRTGLYKGADIAVYGMDADLNIL
jgi:5'-3' exonuclease